MTQSPTRTAAVCLADAMADFASVTAKLATNAMMLALIESHERKQRESFARIDALLNKPGAFGGVEYV